EYADVIKLVGSDEFWRAVTVADLEAIRKSLSEIMHHRGRMIALWSNHTTECCCSVAGEQMQPVASLSIPRTGRSTGAACPHQIRRQEGPADHGGLGR
ncbi:MAG: hypothetical protein KGL29_02415, partial [Alphaproteobacteria bacterium]|nr:hypothetical protein [Alphaproteobacteria bacterium]